MTARKPKAAPEPDPTRDMTDGVDDGAEPTVAPEAEEKIPIRQDLLPLSFRKVDVCPKCGGDYLTWEHHAFAILSEGCGRKLADADVAIGSDWWNLYPEHLDVKCNNCKYTWLMEVFADVV